MLVPTRAQLRFTSNWYLYLNSNLDSLEFLLELDQLEFTCNWHLDSNLDSLEFTSN